MNQTSLSQLLHLNLVSSVDLSGLLEPQKKHVIDLINGIDKHGFACDLSSTGCGKTYSACAIARHYQRIDNSPIYIFSPKAVIPSWNKILVSMNVKNAFVVNYEKASRGKMPGFVTKRMVQDVRTKTRVEKEMLRFDIPKNAFIVFDESHKCKGMKSNNSELLLAAYEQKYKFLTVSATQAVTPLDMFVFGYILNEHNFMDDTGNFYAWGRQFGGEWAETRDGFKIDTKSNVSMERMKKLHDKLFNMGIARRLTTQDFGSSFPSNRILPGIFDMGNEGIEIREILEQMEYEIAKLSEKNYTNHILAVIIKARRHAELLKAPTIVEQILEHRREDKSVCVFVNFCDTIDAIVSRVEKELGKNSCCIIRGGQKDVIRQQNIDDFQDNTKRIVICNMAAGGVGISLHDIHGNHPRVSLISPGWSAVQLVQAFGRIPRAEGKTECLQYIIYCAGTIEEDIAIKVGNKLGNLDALNDGDLFGKDYGLPMELSQRLSEDLEDMINELDLNPLAV